VHLLVTACPLSWPSSSPQASSTATLRRRHGLRYALTCGHDLGEAPAVPEHSGHRGPRIADRAPSSGL